MLYMYNVYCTCIMYESRTKCHKSDTDKMPQDKILQNENRTKCHRIRMHQNCNNKSYNSVTKA